MYIWDKNCVSRLFVFSSSQRSRDMGHWKTVRLSFLVYRNIEMDRNGPKYRNGPFFPLFSFFSPNFFIFFYLLLSFNFIRRLLGQLVVDDAKVVLLLFVFVSSSLCPGDGSTWLKYCWLGCYTNAFDNIGNHGQGEFLSPLNKGLNGQYNI